jgi:hypothetical protein
MMDVKHVIPFKSTIVQLQSHTIIDLIIFQCDVILIDVIPLLEAQFFRFCSGLRSDDFFQISNRILGTKRGSNCKKMRAGAFQMRQKGHTEFPMRSVEARGSNCGMKMAERVTTRKIGMIDEGRTCT